MSKYYEEITITETSEMPEESGYGNKNEVFVINLIGRMPQKQSAYWDGCNWIFGGNMAGKFFFTAWLKELPQGTEIKK